MCLVDIYIYPEKYIWNTSVALTKKLYQPICFQLHQKIDNTLIHITYIVHEC